MALPSPNRFRDPRLWAEMVAAGWEIFSALLFVSAVVPAAFTTPLPALIFGGSIAISAAISRPLMALGVRGYAIAGVFRVAVWPLAVAPLAETPRLHVLVPALAFGLMAGGMRRTIYRKFLDDDGEQLDDAALGEGLRARLAESAIMAGIVGGHVLLLFSVAFLRTKSQVVFKAWFDLVPILALAGTVGFTLALRPATAAILRALEAGPKGDRAVLERGLARAIALPSVLAYLNFAVWLLCTASGVLTMRPGPASWQVGDAVMELAFGSLLSWGVAFYQRAWHRDTVAPAVERLRRWTSAEVDVEPTPLGRRMLKDFGLPLLFTGALSLLSSIGLYRALGTDLGLREDFNAVTALVTSFTMLVIAVGGVVVRAARDLSRPMTELAAAADRVARGQLDAAVPRVRGPVEVVKVGESVERMRQALATTIAELSTERAGLEANVEARTAELTRALDELRRAQAALIQGERLASIGELVAGVAHEIYNPLNAIAGASAPLEDLAPDLRRMLEAYRAAEKDLPPERRRAIEALRREVDLDASLDDLVGISTVIKRATDRSVKIVQNLRNFSRISGEPLPADLHACLEETLMLLAPRLRQGGIQVIRRFGELPPVICRAGEVNQVFMNLLVNAIQALEQPGRSEPSIVLETSVEGDMAVVSVTDSGPGVPPSLERRIFDPFFTTKPRGQGTGLGLSISTEIARRHGGSLSVTHPPEGGASFVCRIPIEKRSSPSRPTFPDPVSLTSPLASPQSSPDRVSSRRA